MPLAPVAPPNAPLRHATPLAQGETFSLDETAAKGLLFREINVKEAFTIVDAEGTLFRASLKQLTDAGGEAVAYERMRGTTESPARITLVCAVLARQRMIQVVQKATELGCTRIVPMISDKSVQPKELDHEKPWAWPGQALKGARQSRRASIPEVTKPMRFAKALAAAFWTEADARFVLDDRAPAAGDPLAIGRALGAELDVVLAIGPEGGWSDAEREALAAAGAKTLVLGSRVLRAETAVFAGLAVLQHRLGDLHA
jgi:16S rRNA (uracil1498-N3)-methyltransferase